MIDLFLSNSIIAVFGMTTSIIFYVSSIIDRITTKKKTYMPALSISIFHHNLFSLLFMLFSEVITTPIPIKFIFALLYPITGYLIYYYYTKYFIISCVENETIRKRLGIYDICMLIFSLVALLTMAFTKTAFYFDETGTYIRGKLFALSYIIPALGLLVNFVLAIIFPKKTSSKVSFALFTVFPMLLSIISFIYPGIRVLDLSNTFAISILFAFVYASEKRSNIKKEEELKESKVTLMISQIQPHFIYNTLSSISSLCTSDPEKAKKLTVDFAHYLRGNLDSLKNNPMITFENELNHTKTYLEIEKVRFGDKLNIVYDIQESEFLLPALSLQPLVENAVKHGVMKKKGGGKITITTRKDDKRILVSIQDDGVGFDSKTIDWNDGHHVGINNVNERLKILCGGKLVIESSVNQGTNATIIISLTGNKL